MPFLDASGNALARTTRLDRAVPTISGGTRACVTSRRGRAEALTPPRAASRVTVGAMTAMTASRDRAGDDAVPAVDVDYARLMALLRSPHSARCATGTPRP